LGEKGREKRPFIKKEFSGFHEEKGSVSDQSYV